jgi:hypothetical protein
MFTKYLYLTHQVQVCFIDSLLKKSPNEEIYFWFHQLWKEKGDDEMWILIYTIFYDFYAVLNPLFEKYIYKIHQDHSSNNNKSAEHYLLKAIYSLKLLHISSIVFKIRIMDINKERISQNIKHVKILKDKLFLSIDTFNYHDIKYCILLYKNPNNLYIDITNIIGQIYDIKFYNKSRLAKAINMFKTSKYHNKVHMCINLLCYLMCPQEFIWNEDFEYISNPSTIDLSFNQVDISNRNYLDDIIQKFNKSDFRL